MASPRTTGASGDDGGRIVPMRLQRFLARSGVASRRGSEDLMTAGRVRVNGEVVRELGSRVDPLVDVVEVDGRVVTLASTPVYIVLNKPAGYVTTMNDPQGRPTVADIVPRDPAGLFPVGRLDLETTGLLLFTTDGDLAHRLLHPRYHVEKVYHARVQGTPSPEDLDTLAAGVKLEDGMTAPARVRLLDPGPPASVEIAIREGRKRQVRRMFLAVEHAVISLHRESFGPIRLGDLAAGAHRALGSEEVAALWRAAGSDV
ncbi:MAG: pseudouridine synthase [Anaerosomatales bacterium]|nr:pseudouridine synthase [Anaerosomatales bacterium]MDT8433481.1 pseudouridine synthase [Anaerosomatales bacterium]